MKNEVTGNIGLFLVLMLKMWVMGRLPNHIREYEHAYFSASVCFVQGGIKSNLPEKILP